MQAKLLAFGSRVRELFLFLCRSMQILPVGEFKVCLVQAYGFCEYSCISHSLWPSLVPRPHLVEIIFGWGCGLGMRLSLTKLDVGGLISRSRPVLLS